MPPRLKKVLGFLLDVVEMYIPILAFLCIFACFLIQIVSRYFFTPLMWPEELALICFLWAALLGALYTKRSNSMVCFSMIYDAVGPKAQRAMRIAGNCLLVFLLGASLKPSYDYVHFMSYKTSATLGIPLNLAYSCYIIFLVDILARYIVDIANDLRGRESGAAEGGSK
jgi:TRAP-type C4-dicarboxylate transport system permease small subunit